MKNKILTATAVLAAVGVASAFTWSGTEYRVETGFDNGTDTYGYWYDYNDKADGGLSKITWPVDKLGNDYSETALDPVIDECGGVCGTFALDEGTLDYKPFVGLGFNISGTETTSGGSATPENVTGWEGICITYTVSVSASLELGLGDTKDAAIGYDNPYTTLPKSETADEVCTTWGKFKQAGWGQGKVTGEEAGAALASVKFKIQAATGTSGSFNISGVRSIKDIEGVIKAKAAASAVKASLSGRTLSFAGIKSVATAEVMNLQGQVMLKGSVSSSASLDLSSIDAGVYMVRVAGKSVDFSQKIILK